MKNWLNNNYRTLIILAFLIPIIIVAIVSISHVTIWYSASNPLNWAIYLSIGIEIAALSSLAALTADMGRKIWLPFIIVTFIQFIGNVFFAYEFIDIASTIFQSWVELVSPLFEFIGIAAENEIAHKRILSLLSGGLLPVITLSFLHMLIKFTEKEENNNVNKNSDDLKIELDDDTLNNINTWVSNKKPKTKEQIKEEIKNEKEELENEGTDVDGEKGEQKHEMEQQVNPMSKSKNNEKLETIGRDINPEYQDSTDKKKLK